MKIRNKSIIIFLLLSLVPLSIIGAIAYKNGKDTIERNLGSGFHQIAHATINNVDRFLYGINRDIHTWAHLVLMQEVITGDVDGKISSLLSGLNAEYGYFSMINVINLNGEAVASSNHELIGMDLSYEDGYVHAMDLESFVDDLKFDDISGDWVVTFSVPIIAKFEDNKIIGLVSAKLNANELFNLTQNNDMEISGEYYTNHIQGKIMLIKNNGLVISAVGSSASVLFRRNLIEEGLKSASLACRKEEGYIIEMNEGRLSIIGYDHSVGYRDFPGLGWAALVIEETETAFAPIVRLKIMIVGLAAIVSIIIIIISIIIAGKMSNSILKIADVAKRVAHGDFDVRVDYETTDEVGSLIQTFNHMIIDLKEQKKQLVEKEYVDNIIKSMGSCLIVIDPEGVIMTVNQTTCNLLSYNEDELIGEGIDLVFEKDAFKELCVADLISTGFINNEEKCYKSKYETYVPVIFSSSVIRGKDGEVHGIVCVAHDLTERKKLEVELDDKQRELASSNKAISLKNMELNELVEKLKESQSMLIHSEKMSAIGTMVAGVAHELNNPMMGLINFVEYCIENTSPEDKRYRVLQFAEKGVRLCIGIVENLQVFSRSEMMEKEHEAKTNCVEVLDSVLALLSHQIKNDGVSIIKDYSKDVPDVKVALNNMQQIFLNLIGNAIGALEGCKTKDIYIGMSKEGGFVQVKIKDTGNGIEPQNLHKIFDPFYTTKAVGKGTGLGLSITHTIVENHGGQILCESNPGHGTMFKILLPVYDKSLPN